MKARKLIEGATFDPATLATIGEAFDRPWAEIAITSPTIMSKWSSTALRQKRARAGRALSSCRNFSRPTFQNVHTFGREKFPRI